MDFELSASSDEADAAAVAGVGTLAEPEASSDHDTPKEQDAPSSFVADPEGVPVSVRSSSDWEAVTTLDAANDHAGRRGDRLRSPACIDLILLGCHSR